MNDELEGSAGLADAVAIVGLACRFPGAENADQFWDNLVNGREGISFFSGDDLAARGIDATAPGFVPAGGVLPGIDEFDAEYFGISPRDAALMDPQHRLFLQCAVHALEDAGLRPDRGGDVGVYAAAGFNSYLARNLLPAAHELGDRSSVQWLSGSEKDYLATQLSYRLGLTGPSLSVQSACSSALVAVHLAGEALLSGECSVALAGAVSIGLGQDSGYQFTEGGIVSPDGHCRPFDADAQGTVFGSGVAAVVLKRLEDAVADGDPIRAVLLGSAVANDGNRKVGFTAPGLDGQHRVITAAHRVAGIDPSDVSCVEAHGTGTALGDQIELAALNRVFEGSSGDCVLGSVKSNVGHLDTCAGMAGLIKTVLSLQHRQFVPTVHFRRPHPDRGLPGSRFRVLAAAEPWPGADGTRIAGVSSFGIGGTNAHLVLRDAPPSPARSSAEEWHVIPISARTPEAATVLSGQTADALTGADLADAAHTLQLGRGEYPTRRAVVAKTGPDAATALRIAKSVSATGSLPVFAFPGQGNGYPGMAAELHRTEPAFAAALDEALAALDPPLRQLLLDPARPDLFDRTEIAQPALFAVEYALASWWLSLGVTPGALIGHSVGEYAAACVAGVFPLPDAARLVTARGRLMATTPPGAMVSVPLPEHELTDLLSPAVSLAAVNAPDRCVLAGSVEAVAAVERRLAERGVSTKRLATQHAFHSHHQDNILAAFAAEVRGVRLAEPQLPIVSTATGRTLTPAEATSPEYWTRQVREPVRFAAALAETSGPVLELGPGRSLASAARRTDPARLVLPGLTGRTDGLDTPPSWLTALAAVWSHGAEVRWEAQGHRTGRRISLPGYPFAKDRHWFEPSTPAPVPATGSRYHVPNWTRQPQPARPETGEGTVLVVSDTSGLGAAVTKELRALGRTVVEVAGEDFAPLMTRLRTEGRTPDAAVLCRAFDHPDLESATPAEIAAAAESAIADPLFLARALADTFPGHPVRLLCVTRAAQAVGARPPKTPHSAAVLGPVQAIPLELPGLTARCLDLWPEDGTALTTLAERVCAELLSADWPPEGPALIAAHGPARWVRTWEPADLPGSDGDLSSLLRGLPGWVGESPVPPSGPAESPLPRHDLPKPPGTPAGSDSGLRVRAGGSPIPPTDPRPPTRGLATPAGVPQPSGAPAGSPDNLAARASESVLPPTTPATPDGGLPGRAGESPIPPTHGLPSPAAVPQPSGDPAEGCGPAAQASESPIPPTRNPPSPPALPQPPGTPPDSPNTLPAQASDSAPTPPLHPAGACLITGGLGGIGGQIALHLARSGATALVLLGRSNFPDSPLWTSIRPPHTPAGPPFDPATETLLTALAQTGATICLAQADVSDETELRPILARVKTAVGPITGVVHAAGVPGGALAHQATRAGIRRVLAAKVAGTVLLHRILREDRPSFFALCSSTMAVSGVPGQSAYSGANAFLDTFAHTADGLVSIGWDGWAEVGMAARSTATKPKTPLEPFDHPLFDARGATEFRLARNTHTRWLSEEHLLAGTPVLPGSALLELAIAAYRLTEPGHTGPVELSDVRFLNPVEDLSNVVISLHPKENGYTWEVGNHARGFVTAHRGELPEPVKPNKSTMDTLDTSRQSGLVATGPRWDCVAGAWSTGAQALLRLRLAPAFDTDFLAHPLHPALFDVATGAVAAGPELPVGYHRLISYRDLPSELYAWIRRVDRGQQGATTADLDLTDADGNPVARVEGFLLRQASAKSETKTGLTTKEALAAFDRVLANRHLPHIVVSQRTRAAQPERTEPSARPSAVQADYLAPRDETETVLAEIWGRLLGVPRVGVEDDLFELGGDSLLIVQIAAEAQRLGLAVSPSAVFANPTVAGLAAAVREPEAAADEPEAPAVELDEDELATVLGMFAAGTGETP